MRWAPHSTLFSKAEKLFSKASLLLPLCAITNIDTLPHDYYWEKFADQTTSKRAVFTPGSVPCQSVYNGIGKFAQSFPGSKRDILGEGAYR
jgi:hypothetical protein